MPPRSAPRGLPRQQGPARQGRRPPRQLGRPVAEAGRRDVHRGRIATMTGAASAPGSSGSASMPAPPAGSPREGRTAPGRPAPSASMRVSSSGPASIEPSGPGARRSPQGTNPIRSSTAPATASLRREHPAGSGRTAMGRSALPVVRASRNRPRSWVIACFVHVMPASVRRAVQRSPLPPGIRRAVASIAVACRTSPRDCRRAGRGSQVTMPGKT